MATGTPFVPTPLPTTAVRPSVATAFRLVSYIALSEYRFAPTSMGTRRIVAGSPQQDTDSPASLAQVIARASDWVDLICFHKPEGFHTSTVRVEHDKVTVKPDGGFKLICNVPPVRELVGLAVGPIPSQLTNVSPQVAADIWINDKVIHVPASWANTPMPQFIYATDLNNDIYAAWSYVNGWPNVSLAATAQPTDNPPQLICNPPVPGGTTLPGVYAGAVLTIHDGPRTENVVVASTPVGLTIPLTAGVANPHTPPPVTTSPYDFIRVSALPASIEEAAMLLTSVLLKVRGSRAMVMPTGPGGFPTRKAMGIAGALDDFDNACKLLKKYTTVFLHG